MSDILIKLLIATYTFCLPVLVKRISQLRKEKKDENEVIVDTVSKLTDSVNNLSEKLDFNEAMTSRYRIIRAADEIINGVELSDEHLEQLGEDIEIYKAYCAKHDDYKNHKGQLSMKLVLDYERKAVKL